MKDFKTFITKYRIYLLILFCLLIGIVSLVFKNATLDDDLYLWETSIMTEALRRGEWFGDYGVGTHGFIFKLPVALVFLVTGPSLAIATVWNIVLACISLYIFYKILEDVFPDTVYPFLGVLLLFCNFQFILNLPTYMREFPVFLSVLIAIYAFMKRKSYWLIGLTLVLILDAKEYVLFMILPALLIYVLIKEWKGFNFKTMSTYLKSFLPLFLPVILFTLLMIFTSIVPVNMYTLSVIPGVTEGGVEYQIKHFKTELSTTNRIEEEAPTLQKEIKVEDSFWQKIYKGIVSYTGKILYPRSFSFLSIPKMIFIPAFLTSILLFKKKWKDKDFFYILLSLILWSFTFVFIFRASFDRYLFPVLPVVVFFFISFLKDLKKCKEKFYTVIIISGILSFFGLFFEVDYILIKIFLNLLVLLMYLLYISLQGKFKDMEIWLIGILSIITFSVVAFFFYANGQLHQYLLWGNDYEVEEVVSHFNDDEKVILNDVGWDILVKVYRGDNKWDSEWKWVLQDWVPRKNELKEFEKFTSYNMFGKSIRSDKVFIEDNEIEKIGLLVSNLENEAFSYQDRLDDYLNADWLKLRDTVDLKNKRLYIFDVVK